MENTAAKLLYTGAPQYTTLDDDVTHAFANTVLVTQHVPTHTSSQSHPEPNGECR